MTPTGVKVSPNMLQIAAILIPLSMSIGKYLKKEIVRELQNHSSTEIFGVYEKLRCTIKSGHISLFCHFLRLYEDILLRKNVYWIFEIYAQPLLYRNLIKKA